MELQEQFTKPKRAKRKAPLSPPTAAAATTTSATTTSSTGSAHGESFPPVPSPTSSANNSTTTTVEEEDEDMANCLILLARGVARKPGSPLYDCKTCNRTFPSFQALGGHRASHSHNHKKPKSETEQEEELVEETKPKTNKTIIIGPPFGSEARKASVMDNMKPCSSSKVHGCSVCGVVFSSGQALGGHMRRHRAAPPVAPRASTSSEVAEDEPRKLVGLDLDLNLPAPFEDEFEFDEFVAGKRRFVLSGPALVDCYY